MISKLQTIAMKEKLQEIHKAMDSIFDYNFDNYTIYKGYVEQALALIKTIPDSKNNKLQHWKTMVVDELQKELNDRLSGDFKNLSPDEQKSNLKFSKMSVSLLLMNVIMHL